MSNAPVLFLPRAELQPFVRYFWLLKSSEQFRVLTFPIGCPQLIFHRGTPLFIPELGECQHRFTVSGQVNFPAHIEGGGDTEMVVAVFYPHTAGVFIDIPASEFYNQEVSGYDLPDRGLHELADRIPTCLLRRSEKMSLFFYSVITDGGTFAAKKYDARS